MSGIVHISEAANLGLHAMILLAAEPDRTLRTREAAVALGVSEDHLAKVLGGLVRAKLVGSTRGPHGGFRLQRETQSISLLEIYEAIEGPLAPRHCLLGEKRCQGECVLGDFVTRTNEQFRQKMTETRLSDVAGVLRGVVPDDPARPPVTST